MTRFILKAQAFNQYFLKDYYFILSILRVDHFIFINPVIIFQQDLVILNFISGIVLIPTKVIVSFIWSSLYLIFHFISYYSLSYFVLNFLTILRILVNL